jgi:hypothetical protein
MIIIKQTRLVNLAESVEHSLNDLSDKDYEMIVLILNALSKGNKIKVVK